MLFQQEFNKLLKPSYSTKQAESNQLDAKPTETVEVHPTIIEQKTTNVFNSEISLNTISDLLETESLRYGHRLDISSEHMLSQ